ncbi:hypothetical protein LCGC14_1236050 [marine sediment metagenome]|uniref:Uncharacterized protein n=1 Tax=marine sediment metagenome TaxID=412755 RepID=A0A0F9NPB3_9ZZZZ
MANKRPISEYRTSLTENNFTGSDTVLSTTQYQDVWNYTVPAGQIIFFGSGRINLGVDDRGIYSSKLSTSVPAQITPYTARVVLRDANGINQRFIREDLDDAIDIANSGVTGTKVGKGGDTGNEGQLPFVEEDQVIAITVKSLETSPSTVSASDSEITVPVTIQAIK